MRKVFCIVLITLLGASSLVAGTLAGVTLPDTANVGGKSLVLNGIALRTKMGVKVYVAGLYLPQKSSDGTAILNADAPKRIVLHATRELDSGKLKDAIGDGFDASAKANLKAQIDQFMSGLETLKAGEEMAITYLPGTGTILNVNGKDKLTIPGLPFAQAVFGVWLGAKSPGDVKRALLGQ